MAASAFFGIAEEGQCAEPYRLETYGEFRGEASTGDFAPYYMSSNRYGVDGVSPYAAYVRGRVKRNMTDSTRFDYGFGADIMAGYVSPIDYEKYSSTTGDYYRHGVNSGYWYPQQLYGEMRYRSLFLLAGMKEIDRSLFSSLGSGDLVLSRNARPVPQARIGFTNFVDVPFTRGWLQVQAELAFGRFIDDGWKRRQFNDYNSFYTADTWMHYKRLYFRIAPQERFTFTVGMQHAAQFGGTRYTYYKGELTSTEHYPEKWLKILLPLQNEGSNFYDGNHLGSWDLKARYLLPEGNEIELYAQWPWEDGSGLGKLNGFDGVWGLRYSSARRGWIDEAVVEYIDFTNQSGPMHWAPGDFSGTGIPGQATGADDYYNNYAYSAWANYGMTMGNPFIKGPAYNLSGYPRILDNRLRGVHVGLSGSPAPNWDYTLLFSYRTSWGTPFLPAASRRDCTSLLLHGGWKAPAVEGMKVNFAVGFDCGNLLGNSFGVSVGVSWSGDIQIKPRKQ